MIASLRRLHRRLWIVWALLVACASAIILAVQP